MNAYDYKAQKWVTGTEAAHLICNQMGAELDLLNSPRGPEYIRMCAPGITLHGKIENCQAEYDRAARYLKGA